MDSIRCLPTLLRTTDTLVRAAAGVFVPCERSPALLITEPSPAATALTDASYEASVSAVAAGDGSVINKAGLLSQGTKTPAAALTKVSVVRSKVGKHLMESIVSWPAAPGASSYALEVNLTPQNP